VSPSALSTSSRRLALALAATVLAGCSSDDPVSPVERTMTGFFEGTLEEGSLATEQFVAGRSGPAHVVVCAPVGDVIAVTVDDIAGVPDEDGNCVRVDFQGREGRRHFVGITSHEGDGGRYLGCFATSLVDCEPLAVERTPTPAGTCTTRPFSADTTTPAGYYDESEFWTGIRLAYELHWITCGQRILADPESEFYADEAYEHSRDSLYAYVDDPDGDDIIVDIYTGRDETVTTRNGAAAVDFNTEHSWPQSLGADELPAFSDLHHLFTSDETANTQRSNHPFGEVVDTLWEGPEVALPGGGTERSVRGLDANENMVFEPRDSKKGDIARAILYFFVRYALDPEFEADLSNFDIEEATLIQWHEQDPPDTFEKQRNAMVFRAQGNRNPFIDHPEWVAAIGDFPN
jgi:endonuclease I